MAISKGKQLEIEAEMAVYEERILEYFSQRHPQDKIWDSTILGVAMKTAKFGIANIDVLKKH